MATATYVGAAGLVQTAQANVLRDQHYVGGVRTTLLEGARTNLLIWSNDLSNAAWTKGGGSGAVLNVTGPDGVASSATAVTGLDNTTGVIYQPSVSVTAGARCEPSFWIQKVTTSGTILLRNQNDFARGSWTINLALLGTGWERVTRSHAAVTVGTEFTGAATNLAGVRIESNTAAVLAVNVWGFDLEVGAFSSSVIPTTTVAVTRNADALSWPFTYAPQAMTAYAKFIEQGAAIASGANYLLHIGNAGDTDPRFLVYSNSGFYTVFHGEALGGVSSAMGSAPTMGQTVELRAVLNADGSVQIGQSINGAAEVVAAASAARALTSAWSGPTVGVQTLGTGNGCTAFISIVFSAGVKTMAQMQAL